MTELIQNLNNALATVDKKTYDDETFVNLIANIFVSNGLTCKYFRRFYKEVIPEKYDEDACEDIYDTIKEADTTGKKYTIDDVVNYIKLHPMKADFSILGEKDPVHTNQKYLDMKKHYEDNEGWCKLQSPAAYGRVVVSGGIKTFQIENEITYFANVNFYVDMKGQETESSLRNSNVVAGSHSVASRRKYPEKFNFARVWVADPDIKTYSRIVFDPLNSDSRALNLFSAYCHFDDGLKTVDINRAFEHYKSLCGYDNACFEYLMNYFAHIVQKPYERVNTAVVMYGSEGIGKNIGIAFLSFIINKDDSIKHTFSKFAE